MRAGGVGSPEQARSIQQLLDEHEAVGIEVLHLSNEEGWAQWCLAHSLWMSGFTQGGRDGNVAAAA